MLSRIAGVALITGVIVASSAAAERILPERRGSGAFRTLPEVEYVHHGGVPLTADLIIPAGDGIYPVVLLVHGGGWSGGDKIYMAGLAHMLAVHGYASMAIMYRLSPASTYPAALDDCRAALAWIRREGPGYRLDASRVAGWGFSAGGQLVGLLATHSEEGAREKLSAAVLGGAPTNLAEIRGMAVHRYLGGTLAQRSELYRDASPITHVSAGDPPIFLYHGVLDEIVPFSQSEEMKRKLDGAGVPSELFPIRDAGHGGFTPGVRAAFDAAVAFLDRWLKRGPAVRRTR